MVSFTSSNVRELTSGAVTRVPVLRETDLHFGARFAEVPRVPHSRTTLRVWILTSSDSETLTIKVTSRTKAITLAQGTSTRTSSDQPLFASVDISALLDQADDGAPITVSVEGTDPDPYDERTWALLSITDNITQQMTIVLAE